MTKPEWIPFWAWQIGHAFIWFVLVPTSGYFCDTLEVHLLWSLMIPPALALALTWWTLEAEILELYRGDQNLKKFTWDVWVKLIAIVLGTIVALTR